MHVDHQGLARHLLGMDACRIGEPVVAVDDVAVHRAGDDACHDAVVVDLLEQVLRIASRKLDAPQVVGAHVVEVAIDVVAQVVVQLRIHHIADAGLHIVPVHITPCNGRAVRADDVGKILGLVAPGLGNDKGDVHVTVLPHALSEAVTCCSQASQNVGRELPSEH